MNSKQRNAAVEFIKQNRGTTVNKLVEHMKKGSLSSRMTTLKIVSNLLETGIIEDQKIGNSFHRLYFSDRNEFNIIDKELREIEIIVDRMENIYRNFQQNIVDRLEFIDPDALQNIADRREVIYANVLQNSKNNDDQPLELRPFFEFTYSYQKSIQIILRSLLARTHDSVHPGKNAQILYTKITELLLKVAKQRNRRIILDDANELTNAGDLLTGLKNRWRQFDKIDNYHILDIGLVNQLIKKIDYYRKDLR